MSPLDHRLPALEHGEYALHGQFMWGSNYTFLVDIEHEGETIQGVYKPTQGEKPLWDFPRHTLSRREVAAYLVSEALQWDLVPPTVYREDGPYGPGSLQVHIEHDPEYHFFTFSPEDRDQLRSVALFDVITNNTDRKGGHVFLDENGHIWAIDHGICFHEDPKLRTVIWDFAGETIPKYLHDDLRTFSDKLRPDSAVFTALLPYITPREIQAMAQRIDEVLAAEIFPHPPPNTRPYPWPLV
jgi:hypothetical protein